MATHGKRGSGPEIAFAGSRVAPMSFGQERLWFLEQFEPDTPAYNVAFATRSAGRLDLTALEKAIREIRRRHEALGAAVRRPGRRPQRLRFPGDREPVHAL